MLGGWGGVGSGTNSSDRFVPEFFSFVCFENLMRKNFKEVGGGRIGFVVV